MLNDLTLKIDNYPSRKALNLYNLADRAKAISDQGNKTAAEATTFYAASGDKLADFENYKISDLGSEIMYNAEKELTLVYKPGPKIDIKA